MKEAERRQTLGTTAASCDAARALLERARLSAFHRGSHLREYLIPKARLQARLPGTWSARALPAFACPSPGMHLPPRSSCRGADTQAAREQAANLPAGTALAPMTRCAAAPRPSHERGLSCNCNGDGCQGGCHGKSYDRLPSWSPTRRHGRACPGHPRLAYGAKDVDARNKCGHDGLNECCINRSTNRHGHAWPGHPCLISADAQDVDARQQGRA